MNLFKSAKNSIKNTSLNVINIVLTLTTLIYLISIYGFEHINKDLVINFIIGAGFALFIVMTIITLITIILTVSFKIVATKIINNFDIVNELLQQTNNTKEKAQDE